MRLRLSTVIPRAMGPVQACKPQSFTSPHSLVRNRVSATVRVVNPKGPFELTTPSWLGITVDGPVAEIVDNFFEIPDTRRLKNLVQFYSHQC